MKKSVLAAAVSVCVLFAVAQQKVVTPKVERWLTDPARKVFFEKQSSLGTNEAATVTITINDQHRYQSIEGFGFALTGGSAGHLYQMSAAARTALLRELFLVNGKSIGTSYLRVSIGASDLDPAPFSYNDLAAGETDPELKKFSIDLDRKALIPVLKEILAINPSIKIMGSPWSPPAWMKTNNDTRGGSLKPEFFPVYANYFVKYIQAMKKEGIVIDAITVQNEPLHPGNNPSLLMLANEQAEFIKNHLGPAFTKAGIKTKIIIYDHNCDKPEYAIDILDDPAAKKYVFGSAFHLYAGTIDALSKVHDAHPDKHLYFTEQWVGGPGNMQRDITEHVRNLIIGASRNWSRTVIEWNLSSDPQYQPHTDRGGCDRCLGAVTISRDTVKRNPAYYIIAHAAKFVRPGAVRVGSNMDGDLKNVAFKTTNGKFVLIVLNDGAVTSTFRVKQQNKNFISSLAAGAVATYTW